MYVWCSPFVPREPKQDVKLSERVTNEFIEYYGQGEVLGLYKQELIETVNGVENVYKTFTDTLIYSKPEWIVVDGQIRNYNPDSIKKEYHPTDTDSLFWEVNVYNFLDNVVMDSIDLVYPNHESCQCY